jgi:IS605 OrfB family transposase
MQLVEQHVSCDADPRYAALDRAAFASKNLYNAANYLVRQSFIHAGISRNFAAVYHRIKDHEACCALPRTGSNAVLRPLDHDGRAGLAVLDIGTPCIGKNPLRKQQARMGKRNKQHVVQVPHARFIEMLSYTAELVGIRVVLTQESYTSQASFLDADPLPI